LQLFSGKLTIIPSACAPLIRFTHDMLALSMKRRGAGGILFVGTVLFLLLSSKISLSADNLPPLPSPVSNNAVTSVRINGTTLVYSFAGIGPDKNWNSVSNAAYALNLKYEKWTTIRSAPGTGRLAAVAASAQDQVFFIGGFVPEQSGLEAIVPDVAVYDPVGLRWYRGPDLPTPVRDAITGVYRDRYIYVIGGLSRKGPTNDVQVYDVQDRHWLQAAPFPGTPVFGHAGTLVGDAIILIDGAKKNAPAAKPFYEISNECWIGRIDRHDPKKIEWNKLPPHPGTAGYRIAAGGSAHDMKAYFAGGSGAIYDFSGVGLDGKPAEPLSQVFAYDLRSNAWETLPGKTPNPIMDESSLVPTPDGLIEVGGMTSGLKVVANTSQLPKSK
jgi:N-acetylneuraminic acid mutarotase